LARSVPPPLLLIAAAVLLEVAVLSASRLTRLSPASGDRRASPSAGSADQPVGGSSAIAGLTHAIRSPYLLGVSAFLLLFAITSTFLYFQQAAIVAASFSDRGSQTAFFATLDLCVNTVTLVIQLFVTGRVLGTLGIAVALALLPGLTALGFGVLAFAPTLATVAVFQVLRRSADYSIARPAREVLFTVVPREDRYKAKAFIDTFVYRLGDQVGAWSMALLGAISNAAGALAAILLAIAWLINALWLGRQQRSREKIAAGASLN
jgi:AAA family ATP:ADP antiporter